LNIKAQSTVNQIFKYFGESGKMNIGLVYSH